MPELLSTMTLPLKKSIYYPTKQLAGLIKHYQWYEAKETTTHFSQVIYPNFTTGMLLFFCSGQAVLAYNEHSGMVELPSACLLSPLTMPMHLHIKTPFKALKIVFHPTAIADLYNLSMHRFKNKLAVSLGEVDEKMDRCYLRMSDKLSPSNCIQQFEQYLWERRSTSPRSGLFERASAIVHKLQYVLTVQQLANALELSKRHLNRRMNRELGFSAKSFLRIHRFQVALSYLHRKPMPTLSQVAYRFGYCDQPHFSHEFKRMTNCTLLQYLQSINLLDPS